ncbi:MAG: hypothetical protein GYA36_03770 [Veillonellaceae bacterium]|nr:hypothetical protein [Veillonellaceae bacterium]
MKKQNGPLRANLTRRMLGVKSPSDWLRALRAIKEILGGADPATRRQMGIALLGLAPIIDVDEKALLDSFAVSKEAVEREVPADILKTRGLFFCLVNSPQLSPTCKLFYDAWASVATDLAQSR